MKYWEDLDGAVSRHVSEACHQGERILVQGKDGSVAVLVPVEDLEVLESIDQDT